jgi:hypothetical protein
VDTIQGKVISGVLMELKEEYTLRVAFQQSHWCHRCGKLHFGKW